MSFSGIQGEADHSCVMYSLERNPTEFVRSLTPTEDHTYIYLVHNEFEKIN